MSQQLSFTITASDQASKVVDQVKKKVQDMGKDVGKSIAAFVTPVALVTGAINMIATKMAEMKQKAQEAFDFGVGVGESADQLGVTVEQFQAITAAAEKSGQSVDKVGKAFKLANDLIIAARAGNEEAIKAIEALGIKMSDIDKSKPEEVLRALAAALSTTEDPAKRAAMAVAALGKSAKDLQETLAKGFDIAGALEGTEGLSTEEIDLLRERQKKDREAANREKVKAAREAARQEFLQTPEGKEFRRRNTTYTPGSDMYTPGVEIGPTNEQIDAELSRVRRAKKEAEDKARRDAENATKEGQNKEKIAKDLEDKAKRDAEDEKKKEKEKEVDKEKKKDEPKSPAKIKEEVERYAPLTVSSLREIGGGMAGEISMAEQIAKDSLEYQRRTAEALEKIIQSQQPITDFTKPIPTNLPAGVLPGGPRMIG